MDTAAPLLKLLHVALAMALVAGLAGRWIVLDRAAASRDLPRTVTLLEAAGAFERTVIVSSLLVLPAGLLTAWAQGYEWLGLTTGWMLTAFVITSAFWRSCRPSSCPAAGGSMQRWRPHTRQAASRRS